MTIKILSNSTINKIAAGEVIERPASVVKELVENAIDAGSSKVDIALDCAGKNLIVITDDGFGMSKEDLELAILRHATSKLDEDDLLNINSFGFRGEALPSIGAISKFKITSRKRGTDKSYSISIIGGQVEGVVSANCHEGTIVEVRDLFFSTPARLKFLRSDRTELGAILSTIKKIALSHPNIAFTLQADGKELLKTRKQTGNDEEALRARIVELMGNDFADNAGIVSFLRDDISIYGYTSIPTFNRASGEDQFLFINNRPVKDKILNIALKVAYQDFLARDRHPVAALFLRINPQMVDVNVHPAKTEVRFHDPNSVRSMFISAIKEALSKTSHKVSTTIAHDALKYMTPPSYNNVMREDNNSYKAQNNNFQMPFASSSSTPGHNGLRADYALAASNQNQASIFESEPVARILETEETPPNNYPLGAVKTQLHDTYIVSQTHDSIIITDQHAAHERLGYEKIKKQIEQNGLIRQRLLIPEIVELPDARRAEVIEENKAHLEKLGMIVEKFGEKSIIVLELPSLIGDVNPSSLVMDLAHHFLEMGENVALSSLIEHVTETYACHYAIRAGRKLSVYEMNSLLREMEETPFSGQCNHGRPTYVELKLKDIEKLFGRR